MTINIQNCSNVTVNGRHHSRNCKAVYNITTGDMYASVCDAADAIGVTQGAISTAICDHQKRTCKGMRFCFASKIMEHLEEINEANHVRMTKVAAYEEQQPLRAAIRKAKAEIVAHQDKIAELQAQIDAETTLLNEAKAELERLYEEI